MSAARPAIRFFSVSAFLRRVRPKRFHGSMPLHHLAAGAALVLDNIPVAMLLAVFEASVETQEHVNQPTPNKAGQKDTWSTLQTIYQLAPLIRFAFTYLRPRKIVVGRRELVKLG